ncbi:hypothetical protein CsatB_017993 [Cannabis sativa]
MIFIDEKENVMHATTRKIFVSKFKNLLSEGSLYSVKNFKVIPSAGEYRPVSTGYKIIFHRNTLVMKLEEGSIKIPTHGFQFISQNLIDSRVNDHTILSGIYIMFNISMWCRSKSYNRLFSHFKNYFMG